MPNSPRILVTGANGQIGTVLSAALRAVHGTDAVLCTDIVVPTPDSPCARNFALLDVLDTPRLHALITEHRIDTVYHLSAVLSARGEADPQHTWRVNVDGLINVLEAARAGLIAHVFFPSTIAVFGPNVPSEATPDDAVLNPTTVYGMSKAAGENWCAYYHARWGVDVRGLRYPGVIGHQSLPGGGTTDYAVDIFHQALAHGRYECFLTADQRLPMIYMDDAIRATLEIMAAPAQNIRRRTSYNLHGLSFSPAEIAAELSHQLHERGIGELVVDYRPDFRQAIAASWPRSINDSDARTDWGWEPRFDLRTLVSDMIDHLAIHAACPRLKEGNVYANVRTELAAELAAINEAGLFKREAVLTSAQGAHVSVGGQRLINFCANNYLGLSAHPEVVAAAHAALDTHGFGLSSVRFICGTQDLHKELEAAIARFTGMEDAILYAAAFDANGGLFEPLLDERDAIVSDELNHASIIDGIRLSKAQRYRYRNNDIDALEDSVREARAQGARRVLIVSDGAFSMDGVIAQVDRICDVAERHDAMVMIDDCHATGFLGATGRGSHELAGCMDRVDIVTGTFGKALGGASGGFTAARREIVELLRQRSRPYLFSNTLAPAVAGGSLRAIELISGSTALRDRLEASTRRFRSAMTELGFTILGAGHPISPVLLGEAPLAQEFSRRLRAEGILAVGFFYPVVGHGKARIRVQISAVHSDEDIDAAVTAFAKVGRELSVIG